MDTIEIRQNKKIVIPMLAVLTAGLIGTTYYIYFSGTYDNNNTMKIAYIFLNTLILYAIYIPTKKLIKNEPVLTFRSSEIEINEKGNPVSFLWLQIINWEIEKEEDGGTQYLIIETADTKKRINISWLDKRPIEIEKLMRTYKSK